MADLRSFLESPQMGLMDQLRMFQQQRGEQAQSSNPYQQMQDARYQQARSQPAVSMPGQLLQNYMTQLAFKPMQRPAPAKATQQIAGELSGGGGGYTGYRADNSASTYDPGATYAPVSSVAGLLGDMGMTTLSDALASTNGPNYSNEGYGMSAPSVGGDPTDAGSIGAVNGSDSMSDGYGGSGAGGFSSSDGEGGGGGGGK